MATEATPLLDKVTEAAQPVNAARITFKNSTAPDEPVLDEGQEEGADTQTPLDEAAVVQDPTPPALEHGEKLRLAALRKTDSTFDEDLIEKLLGEKEVADRAAAQAQYLYNKSPAFRKAYLTALKEDGGTLTPEEEAYVAQQPEKATETKTGETQYTEQQLRDWIKTKCKEARAAMTPEEDIADMRESLMEKWVHAPAREKAAKAEEMRKATEARQQREQSIAAGAKAEGAEVLLSYPKLFKADPRAPYGVVCTDKDVWAEIVDQGGVKSMKEATTKALKILQRHTSNVPQQTTRAAVSAPRTNNTAPTTTKQADPEPGKVRMSFKTTTAPRRG